jgi:hypothetical protein
MMKRARVITVMAAITTSLAWAAPMLLSPTSEVEGRTTIATRKGTTQGVHVSVQTWGITDQGQATQEIPLHGFYVAHLISGRISAMIGGKTTKHAPGDYWTVKPGAAMQIRVLREAAVMETTVVTKE